MKGSDMFLWKDPWVKDQVSVHLAYMTSTAFLQYSYTVDTLVRVGVLNPI